MNFDFGNKEFREQLKNKEREILSFLDLDIQETNLFKSIRASLLSFIGQKTNKDFIVLMIKAEERQQDLPDIENDKLIKIIQQESTYYNFITINSKLDIINHEKKELPCDCNESRRNLTSLSKDGTIIFLIAPEYLNYFIDGKDYGNGIFYSNESYRSYKEKHPIEEINIVFNQFRSYLNKKINYENFFISKSQLRSLKKDLGEKSDEKTFIQKYKHLLQNKPEDRFRESLRQYLSENLRVNFIDKEIMLENSRRLDIAMFDESGFNIYFIEVKWVGESIHSTGKQIGTSFSEKDIVPDAYIQTIDYLHQLDKQNQNAKKGFLIVFDARKEDLEDTGKKFKQEMLSVENKKHYYKFEKIDDFRVKNDNPAA